jgi:hypothetical protein
MRPVEAESFAEQPGCVVLPICAVGTARHRPNGPSSAYSTPFHSPPSPTRRAVAASTRAAFQSLASPRTVARLELHQFALEVADPGGGAVCRDTRGGVRNDVVRRADDGVLDVMYCRAHALEHDT